MSISLTDADYLARSQRKRRWIYRISLGLILVVLLLGLTAFALTTSVMSIEEAKAAYEGIESPSVTMSQVVSRFGKPGYSINLKYGELHCWYYTKSTLNSMEVFTVMVHVTKGVEYCRVLQNSQQFAGGMAWDFRWRLLKLRLGFDPK